MPVIRNDAPNKHRNKESHRTFPFNVCVARSVSKREIETSPDAQAALLKEWERLRQAGCWDETSVREWSEVADMAGRANPRRM